MTRKWFDSKPLYLPEPILNAAPVTVEAAEELLSVLIQARGPKAAKTFMLMSRLSAMAPAQRLEHNLKTLLHLVANNNVRSVIPDGLTPDELQALIVLQTYDIPASVKETSQGLLHVNERYQLLAAVGRMFREARRDTRGDWRCPV